MLYHMSFVTFWPFTFHFSRINFDLMITKTPKSSTKKFIKKAATALFVIEGLAFVGSYYVWHKTNTQRDFRNYLRQNYPFVLETFYRTSEFLNSDSNVRSIDKAYWDKEIDG